MHINKDVISSLGFSDNDKPLKLHSSFILSPEPFDGITALCTLGGMLLLITEVYVWEKLLNFLKLCPR